MVDANKNPLSPEQPKDEYYPLHLDPALQAVSDVDPHFGSIYDSYVALFHRCDPADASEQDVAMLGLAEQHLLFVMEKRNIGRSIRPDDAG